MVVLKPIEREILQVFFLRISQMLNVSTFGNTADIYAIVHLVPHACQHITVEQSHSSGDTVAKIWRLAGSGDTKTVSFTNPQKKKSHRVKSGDQGGHRINASSFFLCVLSTSVARFDWDTLARLCSEPESHLVERCNHYCLHSTVASASFLTSFSDLWKIPYSICYNVLIPLRPYKQRQQFLFLSVLQFVSKLPNMYTFSTKGLPLHGWKLKIWYFYISVTSWISRRYKPLVNAYFVVWRLVHLNDKVAIG